MHPFMEEEEWGDQAGASRAGLIPRGRLADLARRDLPLELPFRALPYPRSFSSCRGIPTGSSSKSSGD